MSKYVELPIDLIELDKSNPRIANYLATHDEKDITSELMALLLGTTSDSCASLRQSIEANYGIIHPIVVNKRSDGTYVVIEGNTRLQIYKDFRKENKPGNWDTIRCLVYEGIDSEEMHRISFEEAQTVFYDDKALLIDDPDHSEEEERFILLGFSQRANMLVVCHCYRHSDSVIRIISARKATKNEERAYNARFD